MSAFTGRGTRMIVDCTPLYVQILEQIENEICTGKWQEGKRIPSVSELAHQYQVAPQTVSHSLHLLVQQRILKPKRGIGMVICAGSVQRLKQKKLDELLSLVYRARKEAQLLQIGREEIFASLC